MYMDPFEVTIHVTIALWHQTIGWKLSDTEIPRHHKAPYPQTEYKYRCRFWHQYRENYCTRMLWWSRQIPTGDNWRMLPLDCRWIANHTVLKEINDDRGEKKENATDANSVSNDLEQTTFSQVWLQILRILNTLCISARAQLFKTTSVDVVN